MVRWECRETFWRHVVYGEIFSKNCVCVGITSTYIYVCINVNIHTYMYWVFPLPSNSGKQRSIGIPDEKCNNPGGHYYWGLGTTQYVYVARIPRHSMYGVFAFI